MRSKAPTKDYIKKRLKKKNQPEAKHKRRGEKKKKRNKQTTRKKANDECEGRRDFPGTGNTPEEKKNNRGIATTEAHQRPRRRTRVVAATAGEEKGKNKAKNAEETCERHEKREKNVKNVPADGPRGGRPVEEQSEKKIREAQSAERTTPRSVLRKVA